MMSRALKEVGGTGDVVAGPVYLHSVKLASVDGVTSGIGKVEVRDHSSGAVLLTLRVPQDDTVSWTAGDPRGVLFGRALHATISGAGPGILATFEYS